MELTSAQLDSTDGAHWRTAGAAQSGKGILYSEKSVETSDTANSTMPEKEHPGA
ncbi:hypothetical protein PR003_g4165 [Phytophthora rubi]|uniref:Uncharacterized protein n=1 Tax=Phytophthora rubi TaxID=129364 RepID=A0A6A3P8W1_9STRA|nr:hypothetical protein PR002_g3999 [Phytophthora rubi]KAE9050408.1 hypothetical protein PR001_g2403 [Phytophthora rubi]KAE9352840.1 hypothetical protein PR003_g4165 [Phytophthora rubi]